MTDDTESRELKDQRVPIMMTPSEVSAIDDWSFQHRIRSRGEAIRRLCQIGLMFDEHRAELNEKFKSAYDAATKTLPLSHEVIARVQSGEATSLERQLTSASAKALTELTRMVLLVRSLVGVANNFKSDEDLKKIIADAKEIWAVEDTTDRPRNDTKDNE
ncbi:hypothetical protein JVX98_19380 [Ensifer sp. PDNC004]|uniref:hypothetical protein n=1 Tax=Ensifer sp. PDNC004 TaxID=2811423 RepID=UPI001965AA43|nr:hypothetical protein [Ensifer sp. PDNC004]QRY66559.1 hypothetical protein JVX98_19380 [Ensifer sp. PDNC004]